MTAVTYMAYGKARLVNPVRASTANRIHSDSGLEGTASSVPNDRLYQRIARKLFGQLNSGAFVVADRLPAEGELAIEHGASRPAVREALIAPEVQGFIEVRVGSGAYVTRLPGQGEQPGFVITAFELTEARLLFEGEAAALAAAHITKDQLDELVKAMTAENLQSEVTEEADREFHLTIAAATRNAGVLRTIEDLWHLR